MEKLQKAEKPEEQPPKYWEEFRPTLKKHGISGSEEEIDSMLNSAASLTVDLLYAFSNLSDDEKKLLVAIVEEPRKKKAYKTPGIRKVMQTLNINKKLLSAYIEINFSPSIVKKVFGKIDTPEKLISSYLKSEDAKKADVLIEEMARSEPYYDLGYMLKNSDPLTRTVFIKELLPSMLQAAVSPESLSYLLTTLRSVATSKKSHYEFFVVLEKFRDLLFLFGPLEKSNFNEVLGCIS